MTTKQHPKTPLFGNGLAYPTTITGPKNLAQNDTAEPHHNLAYNTLAFPKSGSFDVIGHKNSEI